MQTIETASCRIGLGRPCFIIAEAGVNHNGDADLAFQLVDAAVVAKADAVIFQTFQSEKLASPDAPKADYQKETSGAEESQLEMLRRLELPLQVFRDIKYYCREKKILFISTPFDENSVEFLDKIGVELFKVSSGEVTNTPLLRKIAAYGKPVILSTGMSNLEEVKLAVRAMEDAGNAAYALLHCVSNYPADPADANLLAINTMKSVFKCPVGFSDHTLGVSVALAAVALGANIIEKHFTISRSLPGPDHQASLEPDELQTLIRRIRTVESALGNGIKIPADNEKNTALVARKSLVASMDIPAGAILKRKHIDICRPGTGLPPNMINAVVGKRMKIPVSKGAMLTVEMFE